MQNDLAQLLPSFYCLLEAKFCFTIFSVFLPFCVRVCMYLYMIKLMLNAATELQRLAFTLSSAGYKLTLNVYHLSLK